MSPLQMNTKVEKRLLRQWVASIRFVPVDENTPAYFYRNSFKITVNANGEVVVFNDETPASDGYRCIGPRS